MAMPLRAPIRVPTYTTDDLRRFPRDGQRYELLDGFLLVTPAPGTAHQVVLSRLMAVLLGYLPEGAPARVTSPGEIEIAPKLLLDPDILIWPSSYRPGTPWTAISGWWLAVEVSGRASRVYDRDFKRDAYLTLGVREAWLVDLDDRLHPSYHRSPRDLRRARLARADQRGAPIDSGYSSLRHARGSESSAPFDVRSSRKE